MSTKPQGTQKVKGAAQMAAGGALAAAGVAMCVLPGPGLACIAGGAVLASRGQRNYTGRTASKAEQKLEAKAEELGTAAKKEAAKTAQAVAKEAPVVAGKAARVVGKAGVAAAKAGGKLASAGASAVAAKVREKKRQDGAR